MKHNKNILILGGTGFVGEAIVDMLIEEGYLPILLVRSLKSVKRDWEGKVVLIEGNASEIMDFKEHLRHFKPIATIYLIGLIKETSKLKFKDLNYSFAKLSLALTRSLGIPHFIYMSASGAEFQATEYQYTKYLAEKEVKNSGVNYTIFRPSIILDESDKFNFLKLIDTLISFRIVPLFGGGHFFIKPVSRERVATEFVNSLTDKFYINTVKRVSGKPITFKDFILDRAKKKNKKIFFIPIPFGFLKFIAFIFSWLPIFPFSVEQMEMLEMEV